MKFENVSSVDVSGFVVKNCSVSESLIVVENVAKFSIVSSIFSYNNCEECWGVCLSISNSEASINETLFYRN